MDFDPASTFSAPLLSGHLRVGCNTGCSEIHKLSLPDTHEASSSASANIQSELRNSKHHCLWLAGCSKSFTRPSDLERHWHSVHLGERHHCSWFGCGNNQGRGFCRLEKLRKHQKGVHGVILA
ncbi:hypothetical protein BDZ45DRAFT_409479 [Acephala macrosclerotiorum]|nr:hypothetical protein BDZ45DRAFT_409479 [Acephala macrosclerotiorum]